MTDRDRVMAPASGFAENSGKTSCCPAHGGCHTAADMLNSDKYLSLWKVVAWMVLSSRRPQEDPLSDHLTPEQAREHLATLQARTLDTSRDRTVHAGATAVFGVVTALYMASQNILAGWVGHTVGTAVFLAAWLVTVWWIERVARTVPRRAKAWSRAGIVVSFVLTLTVVLPWLNLSAQTSPNTWPMVAAGAALAAVPALAAAAMIRWGTK